MGILDFGFWILGVKYIERRIGIWVGRVKLLVKCEFFVGNWDGGSSQPMRVE